MVDFNKIASKWQKKWETSKIFEVKEDSNRKKYYVLEMLPYPSGGGLHMGHARNYTLGDVLARYKRMGGFNVLYPMGYDSFGLPAENAAIKAKRHPKEFTENAIKTFINQQKGLGLSYDWTRMIQAHKPEYYKWDQWIFLKMFEKGLAYKKISSVNWCPKCNTVLANEQVHDGNCWRHTDTEVEQKELDQWFFKITNYAEELLSDIDKLEGWSKDVKIMQKNWIGKKYGYDQYYTINGTDIKMSTFTTHHHTSYAEIFIAIAPEHPLGLELTKGTEYEKGAKDFIERIKKKKLRGEFIPESAKEGYFIGRYSKDFCSGRDLPIYIADFALMEFGTGIVKASCHDQRDFDFAIAHDIPLVEVLFPNKLVEKSKNTYDIIHPGISDNDMKDYRYDGNYNDVSIGEVNLISKKDLVEVELNIKKDAPSPELQESAVLRQLTYLSFYEDKYARMTIKNIKKCSMKLNDFVEIGFLPQEDGTFLLEKGKEKVPFSYDGQGYMFRSDQFTGLSVPGAKKKMGVWMEKKGFAKKTFTYGLRDWLISRQRFWGTPIPIIYCDKCGAVPVAENDLPVKLPENIKFESASNPLVSYEPFVNAKCPKCGGQGKRETDTMDTFVNSSWYFLRYCDANNGEMIFDSKKANYWMPIDTYIGGKEHACMHLIYFRFYTKFLRDLGLLKIDEPCTKLFNQGMLHGNDGVVMSKSRGNVVLPEEIAKKYGIDTARLFLLFVASPDKDMEWDEKGIEGSFRFLNKFYHLVSEKKRGSMSDKEESKLNKTIKEVTLTIDGMAFNKSIISLMQFINWFSNQETISKESAEKLVLLMSPFTPHICEELWRGLGEEEFCSLAKWPTYDEKKIDSKLEAAEEVISKTISDISNVLKLIKVDKSKKITLIVSLKWKYQFMNLFKKEVEKSRDVKVLMGSCMVGELKKYGNDISKMIPALLKDASKVPSEILSQDIEFKNLMEANELISKEFGCEIIVERAEDSKEGKAKNASPSKPAIVVE